MESASELITRRLLTVTEPPPARTALARMGLTSAPATEFIMGAISRAKGPVVTDPPPTPPSLPAVEQAMQNAITPNPADALPELLATTYGAAQAQIRSVDISSNWAALQSWFQTLNTDPRLRVAAALGRQVVAAQRAGVGETAEQTWSAISALAAQRNSWLLQRWQLVHQEPPPSGATGMADPLAGALNAYSAATGQLDASMHAPRRG
jgi:hypothetical protein